MLSLSHIDVSAELTRLSIAWTAEREGSVRIVCPFHDDSKPSCDVDTVKRVFKCRSCPAGGDVVRLFAKIRGLSREATQDDLRHRYGVGQDDKPVDIEVIERNHEELWRTPSMLNELRIRGVSDRVMRLRRYGVAADRITIPVKSEIGLYVNLRRYKPGAQTKKMLNLPGRGRGRLYPDGQMDYDVIVVCAGEVKADVAGELLNPHNIGAVCCTSGETNIPPEVLSLFVGKTVLVMMDVDAAGAKATRQWCAALITVATSLHVVELPLDRAKYPKGDVNNYVADESGDLLSLVREAMTRPYVASPTAGVDLVDEEPRRVTLARACTAESCGKRVSFKATVTAMVESPYLVPRIVTPRCTRDQTMCFSCAVAQTGDGENFEVPRESQHLLGMVDCPEERMMLSVRGAIGVPPTCKVVTFDVDESYDAYDVHVSPMMEITNEDADQAERHALCVVKEDVMTSSSYEFIGRVHPHPKTQQATIVVSSMRPTEDALSTYKPAPGSLDALQLFRPTAWTEDALREKLDHVYSDLERNVTGIYSRRHLHLAIDLAYHSPLWLTFNDAKIKGWVELLILGDSAQGKSTAVCGIDGRGGLMAHYKLGSRVECKNSSVAGLLGGVQQLDKRYYITWGVIPRNDRGLVVLEELKGASKEVISKLTDMRSSGTADVTKISSRRALARTRLIMTSNPRESTMSSYPHGARAILDLVGSPEDVRRFDMAAICAAGDVPIDVLNEVASDRVAVEHIYTGELCRALILHSWTRTADQVVFEDAALRRTMRAATDLSGRFSCDDIPLMDRATSKLKIARLAASLAARTFSTLDDDADVILVRQCHVDHVAKTLSDMYSADNFQYDQMTSETKKQGTLVDENVVTQILASWPNGRLVCDKLTYAQPMQPRDMMTLLLANGDELLARSQLNCLLLNNAITLQDNKYVVTPAFRALMRELSLRNGTLKHAPTFVNKTDF